LADISTPDYETRLAILKRKTTNEKFIIQDDILSNIATKIDTNIRELEGVFNKLIANATLTHANITLEMSEKAINDIIKQQDTVLTIDKILTTTAKYFDISEEDIKSSKRPKEIAIPRQISMYLCRAMLDVPLDAVGAAFGGKDHTTVMHAYKKIHK
jgi:chromosomal replication initiator protein